MTLSGLAECTEFRADAIAKCRPGAVTLLTDFMACVLVGRDSVNAADWAADGTAGIVAQLALQAHAHDRDDLDLPTLTHPGSVIWPIVLGLGACGDLAVRAAAAGYEVMASVGAALRDAAPRWHLTSVAGHAGAAAAAAIVYGSDRDTVRAAIGLAISVAGGLGATSAQRTNATGWHRAAAAVAGLHAARCARAGYAAPADLFEAPNGALVAFGADGPTLSPDTVDGSHATPAIARASIRLYATNGFSQSAVRAAAQVGRELGHAPANATVSVSPLVAASTSAEGPGGTWWDTAHAAAVALATGDEWALENPGRVASALADGLADRIRVDASMRSMLTVQVRAEGHQATITVPPGSDLDADAAEINRKWIELGVRNEAVRITTRALDEPPMSRPSSDFLETLLGKR